MAWPKGSKVLYAWSELSGDSVHPNNTGHAIISELLIYYINTVREHIESIPENIPALPAPLTDASFENGKLLNSMNFQAIKLGSFVVNYNAFWQFKYGWTVSGGTQPIEFKYNAKNIYILTRETRPAERVVPYPSSDGHVIAASIQTTQQLGGSCIFIRCWTAI